MDDLSIEVLNRNDLSGEIWAQAAKFFSENYGIWGLNARSSGATPGSRIRMSPSKLKQECAPPSADSVFYIRGTIDRVLIGHAFACTWTRMGRTVCWITQLVVQADHRSQGVATKLLSKIPAGADFYGVLSSHAHACMAVVNVFVGGIENVDLAKIRREAPGFLACSPVTYVRDAELHGSIFDAVTTDGSVSSADTRFFVDHKEPEEALLSVRERRAGWPFGELAEGHEFLVFLKATRR